jgi:hypothetical protein
MDKEGEAAELRGKAMAEMERLTARSRMRSGAFRVEG